MKERVSRLQAELEAAVRSAGNRHEADWRRADLAANLSRSGRVAEAEAIVADLRPRYVAGHERVTPWLNFAEASIDMANGRGEAALTKMRRAHAMAVAGKLPLAAFAAASLALWYWNRLEVEVAVGHAKEALALATDDDHRSLCRVSLVVADMLAMSRREREAEPWFVRARRHAMLAGDDIAISALAFNLALVHAEAAREAQLQGQTFAVEARSAEIANASSNAFDAILRIPADDLSVVRRAQYLALSDQYEEALSIYEARLGDLKISAAARQHCFFLADTAWCLVNLDRLDDAKPIALEAAVAMTSDTQIDDLAATHSRLARVFAALGDAETAADHQAKADACWQQYRAFQDHCAALCETFLHYAGK